jgi:putative ABC transport system permease protein
MSNTIYSRVRAALARIADAASPSAGNRDFDDELASHLAMLAEENERCGMTPEAARRSARLQLGTTERLRETNRDLRGLPFLETFAQDVRYAFRTLRKSPGFTAVVVLTLALGIGANTAIFSVVYAVMLKPLPYTRPAELVDIGQFTPDIKETPTGWSFANLDDVRRDSATLAAVAGSNFHQLTLTGHGEPQAINTVVVTGDFFNVFAVEPIIGRTLSPDDAKPGAPPQVVLSENLWREIFKADPAILGQSITLDKKQFTVVGVMPSRFRFPDLLQPKQLWVALPQDPLFGSWIARRGGHWLGLTARLKPGVSIDQAQAELDGISARLAQNFPQENAGWSAEVMPLQRSIVGDVRIALYTLLGAVVLVLLIACANIANLLLTRATSRSREMAVRATLGAGRARIVRQLLSETAVLGLLGGIAGVALAYAGVKTLSSLIPEGVSRVNAITVDANVLAFALVLSLLASAAFGLAPALFASRTDLQTSLREGEARAGESGSRRHMRTILAAAEVALAMVLLVGAGLLIRSFAKATAVAPGFDAQNIVKAEISLPRFEYSTPHQWNAFADQLVANVHAEPGMERAAIAVPMPIANGAINLGFDIVGAPPLAPGVNQTADYVSVSPAYFQVMNIPLLEGRSLNQHDVAATPRVTVISRALAQRHFRNEDPIGKKLSFAMPPDPDEPREIVGVVGDVRDIALDKDPGPMMYVPYAQAPFPGANVVVRSTLSAAQVADAVRRSTTQIDKDLPVTEVQKLPDALTSSVDEPRFRTALLGLFAAIALLLAAVGIFGVISYSVSRQTHDIGIRVALGASRSDVLRMVLRETFILAAAGLFVGIPCALGAGRLIAHLLFNVSASDPLTLALVASMLAFVALLAGYIPARRATTIDPMLALRHE